MDVVLVGMPGSGKSAVGRRLARRHGASLVDLDEAIESSAGRSIPEIFATEGEPGFRARERRAVASLGPPDADPGIRRVVATGGGAVVDPRNRWLLYRDRLPVWLEARPEVLSQRLRRSPVERPLLAARDGEVTLRGLAAGRERFYAAAERVNGVATVPSVIAAIERLAGERGHRGLLLRAVTRIGTILLGDGVAGGAVRDTLASLGARRAVIVTEPTAWAACGAPIADALGVAGIPVRTVMLPSGEAAKRLSVIETAARELAALKVERREPIVAVGGGALGDAAGFLAATYLRGIPLVHVPTTLVAQIDSSIGGKTGVDLPEGKNLVGAFHQPTAVIIDVALLATLPERERRAALGEAAKMAVLGDERLFALLEADGPAIAAGDPAAFVSGALAELVERAAWAKVEIVAADEREEGAAAGRITLNLGHSLGHAVEAAGGYADLRHGEAVAYGLRAATRLGVELGVTPPERAERIGLLLDRLALAPGRLPYPAASVRAALGLDKKHAAGQLRWVLPDPTGVVVRTDVADELVERAIAELLSEAHEDGATGAAARAAAGAAPAAAGGAAADRTSADRPEVRA